MKAKTPEELNRLVEENPYEFASFFLEDDSFAFNCYKNYSYDQLKALFALKQPKAEECREWDLSDDEWLKGIEMAMLAYFYEMD